MTGRPRSPSPGAVGRHPHLAEPRREGWVRVDMHLHTMWSGDATTTPDELEDALLATGVDVVCITDHSTTNGAFELRDKLPSRVIVGQEMRTWAGEIIGLFLTERVPYGLKPEEAVERIRGQGGLVYIPHPFDPMRSAMKDEVLASLIAGGGIDAIEAFNAKTSLDHINRRAAEVALEAGIPVGAGSDAHVPSAVGAAYVEMPDFADAATFLAALQQGVIVGHHYDAAREWRPRIVPSTRST